MFAYNSFIDSFQSGKKMFVNMYITDEEVKKSLNAFVDTQTLFTKQVFQTINDVTNYSIKEFKSKFSA